MPTTHGLAGNPQPRPRALEPPASRPTAPVGRPDPAHAVARLAFGPPERRAFDIRYPDGTRERAGAGPPQFTLVLPHPWSLRAMFWPPAESRVAEAFITGAFDVEGDLEAATALAPEIRDRLCRPAALAALLARVLVLPAPPAHRDPVVRLARRHHFARRHSLGRDRAAVRAHYDAGNDFYALWLDERMVYSCAYFRTPDATLDEAQRAKLDHLCRKLRLRPGQRLLDVGCGWGALVIHAASHYGVDATGVTLSSAQAELARARIREADLSGRARVEVRDYRQLAPSEPFDRIASVGMFEHVGRGRMHEYFRTVHRLLRPGGLFLNHGIIESPTRRAGGWRTALRRLVWREGSFIDRDVFPDGDVVPLALEIAAAEAAGFETRDVESLRPHYVRTLRAWVGRLEARYDDAVRAAGETAPRTWRLYMSASAHAFAMAHIGLCQVLFARPDAAGRAPLPLTREDLYSTH